MDIKNGSVVALKSSNIKMTVERATPAEEGVRCVWFDANNQLHRATFDAVLLDVIKD